MTSPARISPRQVHEWEASPALYKQIAAHLARLMLAEDLTPGEQLPDNGDLGEKFGCGEGPAERGKQLLHQAGYLRVATVIITKWNRSYGHSALTANGIPHEEAGQ